MLACARFTSNNNVSYACACPCVRTSENQWINLFFRSNDAIFSPIDLLFYLFSFCLRPSLLATLCPRPCFFKSSNILQRQAVIPNTLSSSKVEYFRFQVPFDNPEHFPILNIPHQRREKFRKVHIHLVLRLLIFSQDRADKRYYSAMNKWDWVRD